MTPKKEVTIYDIAESLNVSSATVSRALQDHPSIRVKTKKKILEKANEMGYRQNLFAQNLSRNRTNTLGVIVPRLNSYFISSVLSGVEKVANEAGYNLVISQSLESEKKEIANIKTMFKSRVDGLLVSLAHDTVDDSNFKMILDKGIPLIFFDRIFENSPGTSVVIDNYAAGYDTTQHLIQQGCTRIVHITANTKRIEFADRLRGYKHALSDNGISYDDSLVFFNNLQESACIDAVRSMLQMNPRPDAIFSSNDLSAIVCMRELRNAGVRIPEDMAIAGFNNEPISTLIEPGLTTVNYPGQQMGEACASMLIRKLSKLQDEPAHKVVFQHQLIIRGSSLRKH